MSTRNRKERYLTRLRMGIRQGSKISTERSANGGNRQEQEFMEKATQHARRSLRLRRKSGDA